MKNKNNNGPNITLKIQRTQFNVISTTQLKKEYIIKMSNLFI